MISENVLKQYFHRYYDVTLFVVNLHAAFLPFLTERFLSSRLIGLAQLDF